MPQSGVGSALPLHKHVPLKLTIKVPPKHRVRHELGRRAPRYVSPATASLAYSIDGGTQTLVSISTSNPDCTVVGPISYLQCTVDITVSPGTHTFSFTTYDADQNVLSANTDVVYQVKTGAANQIPVTLGGVASSLAIISPTGIQSGAFTIYGAAPQKFSVLPVDADGNFIIGPGAPQPVVQATPSSVKMQTPAPSSPNTFTLTSTYTSNSPTTPMKATLTVSATPVPDSGGSPVSAAATLALYQPWVYVINQSGNPFLGQPVMAFDDQGNSKTPTGNNGSPFPLAAPGSNYATLSAIAYDPANGWLYIADSGNNLIEAFDLEGNPQTLAGNAGSPFPGLNSPRGIAYDSHNGWLYVINYNGGAGQVLAFDAQGNQELSFSCSCKPQGIAFDPHNDWLYVIDYADDSIEAYNESGTPELGTIGGGFDEPTSIAHDPHNGFLYVTNAGGPITGTTIAVDENTNRQTLSGPWYDLNSPFGIAYHPSALLYIVNLSSKAVTAYDEQGNEQSLTGNAGSPFSGLKTPINLVVVP